MLKISKFLVILFIILILLDVTVFATDINMNLTQDETSTEDTENDVENIQDNLNNDFEPEADNIGGDAAPSGVSSIAQENMSFSNILNILIITVGVILILFAIAILIRLKN